METRELLDDLRRRGVENTHVELKSAAGGVSASLRETSSAFAITSGGTVLFGLDDDVHPVDIDVAVIRDSLAGMASDDMEPPILGPIEIEVIDGGPWQERQSSLLAGLLEQVTTDDGRSVVEHADGEPKPRRSEAGASRRREEAEHVDLAPDLMAHLAAPRTLPGATRGGRCSAEVRRRSVQDRAEQDGSTGGCRRSKPYPLCCLRELDVVGHHQVRLHGEGGREVDCIRAAQAVRLSRRGEKVGAVDVDEPDGSEQRVDDLRARDSAPTCGAVHLRVQKEG